MHVNIEGVSHELEPIPLMVGRRVVITWTEFVVVGGKQKSRKFQKVIDCFDNHSIEETIADVGEALGVIAVNVENAISEVI